MTAQGEDILAWLENAITVRCDAAKQARAGGAGRWHNGWMLEADILEEGAYGGAGVSDERDRTIVYNEGGRPSEAQSIHIALNDPESVLRRCAADRKLLELHGRHEDDGCRTCVEWSETEYYHVPVPFPCDSFSALAEGYGWTEGQR
ncbi:DUF6221 family protein [Streptomyces asiaticus]